MIFTWLYAPFFFSCNFGSIFAAISNCKLLIGFIGPRGDFLKKKKKNQESRIKTKIKNLILFEQVSGKGVGIFFRDGMAIS